MNVASTCFGLSNDPETAIQLMLTTANTSTLFDVDTECLVTVHPSPIQRAGAKFFLASDTMETPLHCIRRGVDPWCAYNCHEAPWIQHPTFRYPYYLTSSPWRVLGYFVACHHSLIPCIGIIIMCCDHTLLHCCRGTIVECKSDSLSGVCVYEVESSFARVLSRRVATRNTFD